MQKDKTMNWQEGFTSTLAMLLSKPVTATPELERWLQSDLAYRVEEVPSVISGRPVAIAPVLFYQSIAGNAITLDESLEHGKKSLNEQEVEKISLKAAAELLMPIKSTTPEIIYGQNMGTLLCADYGPSQECYGSSFCWFAKRNVFCLFTRECESVYGCSNVVRSQYSVRCSNSSTLTRCLEVMDSGNCTDCLFCFNCENVENGIFCFNTKSKRYAVCNVEVGRERFLRIRKIVQEWALANLCSEGRLPLSVSDLR